MDSSQGENEEAAPIVTEPTPAAAPASEPLSSPAQSQKQIESVSSKTLSRTPGIIFQCNVLTCYTTVYLCAIHQLVFHLCIIFSSCCPRRRMMMMWRLPKQQGQNRWQRELNLMSASYLVYQLQSRCSFRYHFMIVPFQAGFVNFISLLITKCMHIMAVQ